MNILLPISCLSVAGGFLLVLSGCNGRHESTTLDEADKIKSAGLDGRTQDLGSPQPRSKIEDSDLMLLNQFAGPQTTYGARKVRYDESTGIVTLEGEAWVRSRSHLLDGREDLSSHIQLDKRSGRVLEKRGAINLVVLPN